MLIAEQQSKATGSLYLQHCLATSFLCPDVHSPFLSLSVSSFNGCFFLLSPLVSYQESFSSLLTPIPCIPMLLLLFIHLSLPLRSPGKRSKSYWDMQLCHAGEAEHREDLQRHGSGGERKDDLVLCTTGKDLPWQLQPLRSCSSLVLETGF